MPINYSVNPRRNPSEKGTPPKFYAKVQTRGTVSFKGQRILTPLQHQAILDFLGEPGE